MEKSISVLELIEALWADRRLGVTLMMLFGLASVGLALSLPNVYRAQALVASAQDTRGTSSELGGLSALGNLAGFNVSSVGGINSKTLAIEVLKSRKFFIDRIFLKIKEDFSFDLETEEALRAVLKKRAEEKSGSDNTDLLTAHRKFLEKHLRIKNLKTGFVEIAIEHSSPIVAKRWVDIVLREINEELRAQEIQLSEDQIRFLISENEKTNVVNLKDVFARLIEEQIKAKALANVDEDFAFVVVDPAYVPHERLKPNRTLICIVGLIVGLLTFLCIVIVKTLKAPDILSK
jgi:uncharacterized protein involved in exopolysaccharide biosynthesis